MAMEGKLGVQAWMEEHHLQQAVGCAAQPVGVIGGSWGVACRKQAHQAVQLVC